MMQSHKHKAQELLCHMIVLVLLPPFFTWSGYSTRVQTNAAHA